MNAEPTTLQLRQYRSIFISDLHLGLGDRTDGFGHEDGAFLRFLRHLEANFERIVLLGDIWETLTGPRWGDAAASLSAARAAHPEIARRFAGARLSAPDYPHHPTGPRRRGCAARSRHRCRRRRKDE